jgi:hypothetical protein
MIEFMLSRLTMSLCAVIIILTLAPLMYSLPLDENDEGSCSSLEVLVSRFDELSSTPGESKLELTIRDYLMDEDDNFILRKQSLMLICEEGCSVRPFQEGIRIFLASDTSEVEVEEAKLGWASIMVLSKIPTQYGAILEAHIENLEATSDTLAANMSTSSKLL